MKILNRILGAFLSVALLVPTAATTISAVSPIESSAPISAVAEQDGAVVFSVGDNDVYTVGNSAITLKFNSSVNSEEIGKVQIVSLSTGTALDGKWEGSGSQWQFIPYDIADGTHYTIVVPADIFDVNGNKITEDTITHPFRTNPGLSEDASLVASVVTTYDCVNRGVPNGAAGYGLNQATYPFLKHNGQGLQIDMRAITSGVTANPNARLGIFDEIWQDRSYIGKTVKFSFTAKASENGSIGLTLNQRQKYAYTNFPGLNVTADLTTSWQTFTYEFTVTQAMYDCITNGDDPNGIEATGLALGVRFTDFSDNGSTYNAAQIIFKDFIITASDSAGEITNNDALFATFKDERRSAANEINLRFAVDNDINTTVGIYESVHNKLGAKLGEVLVNGAGIYSFDVTDYVKNHSAAPAIALKAEKSGVRIDIPATSIKLAIVTAATQEVLPTVSSSVLATAPDATQNGLWISGGQTGVEKNDSRKSYIKLSLNGYTGGYAAFLFNALSDGNSVISVYGVSDVNAGQNWTPASMTQINAPANDIYGAGVNLNEVYGNAPIATFRIKGYEDSYRVYLTDFAEYMLSKGATEITLIFVSDSANETTIDIAGATNPDIVAKYNCGTTRPTVSQSGYGAISMYEFTDDGFRIFTDNITTSPSNRNANVRIYIFNEIWKNKAAYLNKTIRFSFSAKASEEGSIALALAQQGEGDKYVWGNGFKLISEATDLSTSWKTFTYEFVATAEMFDNIGTSINSPGLSLGVRFYDFTNNGSTYNKASINFRNFVISAVETTGPIVIYEKNFDFSTTKPTVDSRAYNNQTGGIQICSVTNGEVKVNLTSDVKVQSGAYVRINALDEIFADRKYIGRTFTLTFKAKASEAGVMDFAFNKLGTTNTYSYGGTTYNTAYSLTTSYQTFTYQFVAIEDMFTTHASTNLNLAFRFHNGFVENGAYKNAQIYIDDVHVVSYDDVAASAATVTEPIAAVSDTSYDRVFTDVKYDFSTNTPDVKTWGYSTQIASVVNGEVVVDLSKSTNCNSNQAALISALNDIWSNSDNIGKTFTVKFRAKATTSGIMDFAINYKDSFSIYNNHKAQYELLTYYTYHMYTFTMTADMLNSDLVAAFRFYNGFGNGSIYKNAQIYIDDIHIYQDFIIEKPTLDVSNSIAVSDTGVSNSLVAAANTVAVNSEISKSYLSYDLRKITGITDAKIKLMLSGANGDTVRVYLLKNATLPGSLTYANAPVPTGVAVHSFTAQNGENIIDLTRVFRECEGMEIVLVFAIEHLSGNIQITDTEFNITVNIHEYVRHEANAATYNSSGNIAFYTCTGCEKLYVKNGSELVETALEDVILPPVEYETRISSISLNIGKDLTMRYHIVITEGENIEDFSLNFTMEGKPTVNVSEYTYDSSTGKYIFSFNGIAPQLMGDVISAELVKNGQIIDQGDYSVKQYVIDALEIYGDNEYLKQLLADLMYYGAAAQKYIGYKVDDLVTDGLNLNSASSTTPTELDRKKSVSATANESVQFTAAGVRFDSTNRIYVKFTAPSIDGVKVSVGGVDLKIEETKNAGIYIAYSDSISALHFAEKVTFTLSYGAQTVQTLVYTVNDYALAKHTDSRISELALALYRYGKSAIIYDNNK